MSDEETKEWTPGQTKEDPKKYPFAFKMSAKDIIIMDKLLIQHKNRYGEGFTKSQLFQKMFHHCKDCIYFE